MPFLSSLQSKLYAALAALCVCAAAVGALHAGQTYEDALERAAGASLRGAADAFAAQERGEIAKLAATLDALLADDALRAAFEARDRAGLLARAAPLFETMRDRDGITHWYFIEPDPSRRVFLRVHKPELAGDRVERLTLERAVETGELGAGKELGRTAFALRAVRPWIRDGQVIGYQELATEIDHVLGDIKARTGDEYGLVVLKRFLDERRWKEAFGARASTWTDRPEVVVVDATALVDGLLDGVGDVEALPEEGRALGETLREDRAFVRGAFPVRDAAGRKVGALVVLHDFTPEHAALAAARIQVASVLVALGVLLAVALSVLLRLLVFRRLERLRGLLAARVEAARLPPVGLGHLHEDELGQIEALAGRVLDASAPSGGAPAPAGGAGPSTPREPAA